MTARRGSVFVAIWRDAICRSDLKATSRLVALALSVRIMDSAGGSCFPGAHKVVEATGVTIRAVRYALAELEELGWLEVVKRGGRDGKGGRGHATEYVARIPAIPKSATTAPFIPENRAPGAPIANGKGAWPKTGSFHPAFNSRKRPAGTIRCERAGTSVIPAAR